MYFIISSFKSGVLLTDPVPPPLPQPFYMVHPKLTLQVLPPISFHCVDTRNKNVTGVQL